MPDRLEEICVIAQKAMKIDDSAETGMAQWERLAGNSGITSEQLAYYANAYEMAGGSGIRSLYHQEKIPENVRIEAMKKINIYLADRVPPEHRSKIGFMVKSQRSRIMVSEKRSYPVNDPSKTVCHDIFQMRYTDFDKRWHLYWKRASGKWWPHVSSREIYTVEQEQVTVTRAGTGTVARRVSI